MSLRHLALYILIFSLSVYAWKDWFKSLCGLILLMAVIEHSDMPKSIFGIQGLNMWNILFAVIFLAWVTDRFKRGLNWDMPRHINILLLIYLAVILAGVVRAVFDRGAYDNYPLKSLLSDQLINTIKWVLPGVLLFDGCRTRQRILIAMGSILVLYFVISIQVVRYMPFSAAFDSGVLDQKRISLGEYMGYNACDISTFLAGAFWAILAASQMVQKMKYKLLVLGASAIVLFGQAVTGGRAGYIAWGATGLVLSFLKWRKLLLLVPVVIVLLPIVFPSAVNRMFSGFGETDVSGQSVIDEEAVASGRVIIWSYVVDEISKSPIVGYGRLAMNRVGITSIIENDHPGTKAAHPHNMYLEILLDNGLLGSIPIFLFWAILVVYSGILFRSTNRLCSAVGGMALSFMLAQLLAGIGAQHFYPLESTLGVWAAMFLMLRVHVENTKAKFAFNTVENNGNGHLSQ